MRKYAICFWSLKGREYVVADNMIIDTGAGIVIFSNDKIGLFSSYETQTALYKLSGIRMITSEEVEE